MPAPAGSSSPVKGHHFVAGRAESGTGAPFDAADPTTGRALEPRFLDASREQIERACVAAGDAALPFAASEPAVRAKLLRNIGAGLMRLDTTLVQRVVAETGLPDTRVFAECARTVRQLEQFAVAVEEGSWVSASIDRGDPKRTPQPKPDLRRMLVPLGPIAVFGASNFPLAYSVAGGDTASALAIGCPVVVKGHPAHPGTSELVGRVITEAVKELGLPMGTFSLLHGSAVDVGQAIVKHAAIAAVGFTGSYRAGKALFDLANARPRPIPVFAEMGSMNPVFVLPRALAARGAAIAEQLAASAMLASGQFCTSPGLLLWAALPDGGGGHGGGAAFERMLRERISSSPAGHAVHASVRTNYEKALGEVAVLPVTRAASGPVGTGPTLLPCKLLETTPAALLQHERLRHEIYGPAVLSVRCANRTDLFAIARALDGHLTVTVHGDGDDFVEFAELIALLRTKCGRLIANGVPTGVEVCPSMVHGGPWPASSDARFSAVGITSMQRWARPVCWQDWPHDLLPAELRDDNPRSVRRLVDGVVEVRP